MKYPIPSYANDPKMFSEKLENFMSDKSLGVDEMSQIFSVSTDCIESLLEGRHCLPTMDFLDLFIDLSGMIEE